MKFIYVAIKGLKEIFRDKKGLAFLVAFPATFMLVFGLAFSGGQGENKPYPIGVINRDEGEIIASASGEGNEQNFGNELVNTIEGLTFEDSNVSMFETRQVDSTEANKLLQDRDITLLLRIPENFSAAVNQLIKKNVRTEVTSQVGEMLITQFNNMEFSGGGDFNPESFYQENFENSGLVELPENRSLPEVNNQTVNLTIKGDPGYVAYSKSRGVLVGVINQFKERISHRARNKTATEFQSDNQRREEFVQVKSESISGTQSLTTFDYYAPGIFIFALLMSSIGVASSLATEVDKGRLERLKLSKMRSFDLLFGTLIPWSISAIVQVLILFGVALLIGFNWAGGLLSLFYSILIAAIAGVASVALGLLIASFTENESQASNLGTLISVPLSFIVGAFFPLPKVPIGQIFGSTFELYDVLPWTHAAEALRVLLIYGGGINDVALEFGFLIGLTVLLFFIGVFFFSRERLTSVK